MRRASLRTIFASTPLVICSVLAGHHACAGAEQDDVLASRFEADRQLMSAGNYADAAKDLEALLAINPAAIGVRFQLAVCDEHLAKPASAFRTYLEVAGLAHERGQLEREQAARARASEIAPRVPKMTIALTAMPPGTLVLLDGVTTQRETWGAAQPIETGEHVVEVTAPAFHAWRSTLVAREGDILTVLVPPLERDAPVVPSSDAIPPVPVVASDEHPGTWRRSVGWGALAAGAAAVGVGGVMLALSVTDYAHADCSDSTNVCKNQSALDLRARALTFGDAATGLFIGGAVALVGGGALILTAPSSARSRGSARIMVAPGVFSGGAGARLEGEW